MRQRGVIAFVLMALAEAFCTCTDANLEGLPQPPPPIRDDKLVVKGEVCTQGAEDLVFPLRVLFLIDCSDSMEKNDPVDPVTGESGRARAVRETTQQLLDSGGDVRVSVVRFSAMAQPLTAQSNPDGTVASYFTDNLEFITAGLAQLEATDRTTSFVYAIDEARAEIRSELQQAAQESLALSTYHIIMVTDGLPEEEDPNIENSDFVRGVDSLIQIGRIFHVGRITFNTALITSGDATIEKKAGDLLQAMSAAGSGTYRAFATTRELNFLYVNLSMLRRVFTIKNILAENVNARLIDSTLVADTEQPSGTKLPVLTAAPDSDGDGLLDYEELLRGTNPFLPDSDGDGCIDGVEVKFASIGLNPLDRNDACKCFIAEQCVKRQANGSCDCHADSGTDTTWDVGTDAASASTDTDDTDTVAAPKRCCVDLDQDGYCDCIDDDSDSLCDVINFPDGDGDGIADCAERFTSTSRKGADSDGDGLLDFFELRFGTSAGVSDVEDDLDWDAVSNGEEVRTGTDPLFAEKRGRGDFAYKYTIEEAGVKGSEACFSFRVQNITLAEMLRSPQGMIPVKAHAGQGYSGGNRILIYANEVPLDDPQSYGRFRVACVEATYQAAGNYKDPPSGLITVKDEDFVALAQFDPLVNCITPGGKRP